MQRLIKVMSLLVLMLVPMVTHAQTMTTVVADGTATNSYIPIYGYYTDAAQHNQIVYSEELLADIPGVTISGMKFYANGASSWGINATVSIGIVDSPTLSGLNTGATLQQVWSGAVTFNSDNEWSITFDTPFAYTSGNLIVDIVTTTGTYISNSFYGIETDGTTSDCNYYSSDHLQSFVPKTEFTHTTPTLSCYRPYDVTASNITSSSVDIEWVDTLNSGATYTVYYWQNSGDTTELSATTTSISLSGLDDNTDYHLYVISNCSATEQSNKSNTVNFHTDCLNGSCEISVATSGSYSSSYYTPTATVMQNGATIATVQGATQLVNVCSGDTVIVLYTAPNYDYGSNVTVLDGGGTPVFDGSTSNLSTGDTVAIVAVPCPSCLPPTALTIDSTNTSEIYFSWTPRSDATVFAVYLDGELVSSNVTDNSYTFTDLNANTAYVLSVQSACSADDSSSIVSITGRTACGDITLPFFDNFDSYENGVFPPCWHRLRAYGTDPSVNAQFHYSGTQSMFLLASNDTTLFCTPNTIPTAGNNIQVRYQAFLTWASYYDETKWLKGGVMTDTSDMSTFIALDSIGYHNFNDVFEEREFNTANLDPNATYWVAWMFYSTNNGYNSNRGAIDDVYISEMPSCERPATASIGTVGARQVELSWSGIEGSTGYNVYYGTTNDPSSENNQMESVTDTNYTLEGLQPETHYYIWITTDCGGSESDPRYAGDFTTLISCPAINGLAVIDSLTTSEEATIIWSAGDVETEWAVVLDSNEVEIVTDTFYTASGLDALTGHTLYVRAICGEEDTSAASSINFATACADATCNITFNMTDSYGDGWNGNAIQVYQAGVMVGEATIASGNNATQNLEVCSSAAVELRFVSGSYANEMGGTVVDGGGNTVFTIASMGNYSNGDVLATISTPCPECIMPSGLTLDTATATEATISWIAQDGQTDWVVKLDSSEAVATNATSYTFYNLEARTAYTAYVATVCGDDTTMWTSLQFTTDCAGGSCDITVSMNDSYGDGWNGGYIEFTQNGAVAGTAGLTSGNNGTATVSVCSGIPVNYSWHTGSYDSEVSYVIYDGGSAEVYNSATNGVNYSGTILDACPTCLMPTGLAASLIDSTELEFTWNVVDSVYAYLVSFNGGSWTQSIPPYITNNLTPNTAYTFSVMAVCTPNVDTSVAATITVKTACGEMTLPYNESFENDAQGVVPSCWTVVRPGYDGYPAISGSEHTGSNALTMAAAYNDSTTIATSIVPLNGDEIHVSFWASVNQGNTLYAGVMTNIAYDTTFVPIMTIPSNNATYTLYEFNTSAMNDYEMYAVAFRLVTGNTNHYCDIDDINISMEQGCSFPNNITANPGAHNIQLTWSSTATMPTFAIEYHDNTTTTWTAAGTTGDTTYNITGLNAATMYSVRIGMICGTDTMWTSTSATTTCDLVALPYFEDFDSYANDVMPPCWEWSNIFCTHWDGGVFFRSYHGGGSEYAVLPQFDGNITKLQIEFDCKVGTIAEQDGILFGVADAAGVLISWLDTIQDANHSRNAHVHHILNLMSYNVPNGAERLAFAQYRNWGEWALIDNINVTQLPDCYPVDSLQIDNIIDPDHTSFTWASLGEEIQWQVYVDTVTVNIDSVPDSLLTDVYTRYYEIPIGTIQGGGIYTFHVRANCGIDQSNWTSYTFGAGTVVMNNSATADTVVACGLVVYDNGGPIAGYLPNSNSSLVILSENAGSELEVFGGIFGFGSSPATLTIYDSVGTTGEVLYTYNTIDGRDTIDTVLATSTTGALTITFTANGNMCHTGYELYVHCTGTALCERPTQLSAVMTGVGEADVTWAGTSSSYDLYYKPTGASTWTINSFTSTNAHLTGLLPDTTYDMQVVGICGTDTSTASFPIVLNTHYEVVITPCDPATDLTVSNISNTTAQLAWTSEGSQWEIELTNVSGSTTVNANTNPYTLTDLLPNMQYSAKVRTICTGQNEEPNSEWSNSVNFTTTMDGPTMYTLTLTTNNDEWGTVSGAGTYEENTEVTISATANEGYHFERWSDNNTEATRTITITGNMTLTANFAEDGHENTYYTITVTANNSAWGTVEGSGSFIEGSTTTISATPNEGYHFVEWHDGNTENPRTITVIENATYTANFEADDEPQGIDDVVAGTMSLYPNPASSNVTVNVEGFEGQVNVDIVDMNGRVVISQTIRNSQFTFDVSNLSQGAYFVRVTGEQQTAVRKLIVK